MRCSWLISCQRLMDKETATLAPISLSRNDQTRTSTIQSVYNIVKHQKKALSKCFKFSDKIPRD